MFFRNKINSTDCFSSLTEDFTNEIALYEQNSSKKLDTCRIKLCLNIKTDTHIYTNIQSIL